MSKFTHTWSKFLVLTIIFNSRLRYLLFWVCSNSQKVQLSPLKRCKQLLILDLMKEVYSLCRKSWSETPLTAISKKEVIEEFGFNKNDLQLSLILRMDCCKLWNLRSLINAKCKLFSNFRKRLYREEWSSSSRSIFLQRYKTPQLLCKMIQLRFSAKAIIAIIFCAKNQSFRRILWWRGNRIWTT